MTTLLLKMLLIEEDQIISKPRIDLSKPNYLSHGKTIYLFLLISIEEDFIKSSIGSKLVIINEYVSLKEYAPVSNASN